MNLQMMAQSLRPKTSEFTGAERRRDFLGVNRSQEFVGEGCRARNRGWLKVLHASVGQEQDRVLRSRREGKMWSRRSKSMH